MHSLLLFVYSGSSNITSESDLDVVDSTRVAVTSSSSLPVWNRSEAAAASWRAANATQGLAYRVLSPLPGLDGDRRAAFDEDSDVVDRATLPRVAKRSSANSQPSTFNVRL